VLTLLLEENVPISNLTRILESLANQPPTMKDPVELAERVRLDLGRIICDRFRDAQGLINAIVFDPRLAVELRRSLQDKGPALDPLRFEKLVVCLGNAWRTAQVAGKEVALVTDSVLRRAMRQALVRSLPDLSVISVQELPTGFGLNAMTMIRPEDLQA
jgi:flagellar biosynthesis protein FlhA